MKISVIVPVYNVERYLEKCIDSIIGQTYSNLEIILINDASTDNSCYICNKYKEIDKRIVLINNEKNLGLSATRNKGIQIATGKYLVFVDSDDWINANMIQRLYNLITEYNACIVQCNYVKVFDENIDENDNLKKNKEIKVLNNLEALEIMYNPDGVDVVVWNKIYKIDLFKDIRFPDTKIHEDEFVTYKLLDISNSIVLTNESMYFYRERIGSITNSEFNIKRLDIIEAIEEKVFYFKTKKYKYLELISLRQLQNILIHYYVFVYESNINNKNIYLDRIVCEIKKFYLLFLFNKYSNILSTISMNVLLFNRKIFYYLYKKLYKYKKI